jgi:hypothetical protein
MIELLVLAADFGLFIPICGSVLGFFFLLYLSHKYKWRKKWTSYSYRLIKKWNLG